MNSTLRAINRIENRIKESKDIIKKIDERKLARSLWDKIGDNLFFKKG